jgi:N-acetylmuramoyl-L-alanine amidase
VGPTGYFAAQANLKVSKLLAAELQKHGAVVVMTRDDDRYLSLSDRQAIIDREKPTIALTIHYTFASDGQDAEQAQGIRTFWYHPQSESLALFIHNYLIRQLGRSSAGVFWNNLALTRPEIAPSVVLELGFFSNPQEFEWITNTQEQKKLAVSLALGIVEWFETVQNN